RRIDAIHQHLPGIGLHQRVQHAQRGGLARAVGTEQTGDLAVARGEGDAVDGLHFAEGLVQVFYFDHGAAPLKFTKAGIGPMRSRHWVFSCFGCRLATKSSSTSGMQPASMASAWPRPFTTSERPCDRPFSTSSANAGGVTGSRSPEISSVGIDDLKGAWKAFGIAPCGHTLHSAMNALISSSPSSRSSSCGRGVSSGASSVQITDIFMPPSMDSERSPVSSCAWTINGA